MKLNLTICAKICKECPFKSDAIQGYLGHHTTEEILRDMQYELPFSCHLQRTEDPDHNLEQLENGVQNVCRGWVSSASKSAKRFGQHPYYGGQLRDLQDQITDEDKEQVMTRWDFQKYHNDDE